MKFSVLCSVYFKEKPEYLKGAIDSIINQTVKPSEIVLVKDGKLTKELDKIINDYDASNYGLFKIITLEKNVGLGEALRIGVNSCSNEIIARMDTDDICVPDRFEKQIKFLAKHPEVDLVGSYISEFEDNINNIIALRKVPVTVEEVNAFAKTRNPLNHMTVMYKKSSIISVGNYKSFLWNEDYYLWVRLINNNKKIMNIPEPLVYARAGSEMYQRRGGLKYVKNEVRLQKEFLNMGFINLPKFISNVTKRTIVRVVPNNLRSYIYRKFLRG